MVVIAQTSRLIIRTPKFSDWQDVYEAINDKSIIGNLVGAKYPYTEEMAKRFVKKCIGRWRVKHKVLLPFFVELISEKKVIGVMHLVDINQVMGVAEVGYWMHKRYRRKSFTLESMISIYDYAFNTLKLRKLTAHIFSVNKKSCSFQDKLGAVKEGYLRKHVVCSLGKVHDVFVYGLLKSDWKKAAPKLKKELREKLRKK